MSSLWPPKVTEFAVDIYRGSLCTCWYFHLGITLHNAPVSILKITFCLLRSVVTIHIVFILFRCTTPMKISYCFFRMVFYTMEGWYNHFCMADLGKMALSSTFSTLSFSGCTVLLLSIPATMVSTGFLLCAFFLDGLYACLLCT